MLSPGEMGAAVGRRLRSGGWRVVTSLEGRSPRTRELAAAAGIEDAGSLRDAVRHADLLLSILPPGRALDLARAVGRDAGPLYVDCNAIAPATALAVGEEVGERYVDGGIVGPPSAPRLYLSGPHAGELSDLPLEVRVLDGPLGHASALKMCYAALTKGLTALLTESMVTAEGLGLRPAELQRRIDQANRLIDRMHQLAAGGS